VDLEGSLVLDGGTSFFTGGVCPHSIPAAAPPRPSSGRLVLSSPARADRPGASASVARCRRPGRRSVGTRGIRPPTAPYFETTPNF
jgi:hypothetical protein